MLQTGLFSQSKIDRSIFFSLSAGFFHPPPTSNMVGSGQQHRLDHQQPFDRQDPVAGVIGLGDVDGQGSDLILYHARSGDLDAVKRLVLADSTQANYRRVVTPLMWAAYCGHTEVARFLIEHGAKIDEVRE